MRLRIRRWHWAAAAWTFCLLVGSFLSWNLKLAIGTGLREYPLDLIDIPILSAIFGDVVIVNPHRLAHWGGFGCGAMLVLSVADSVGARLAITGVLVAVAASIEAAQAVVFQNAFEWLDLMDDLIAIGFALALVSIWCFLKAVFIRWRPVNAAK